MSCDIQTLGVIDAFHDLGLDPTGQVDGYDVLMQSIRGLTGPIRYNFPAGTFLFKRPILAGPWAPEFHGIGKRLTTLTPGPGNMKPVIVYGLREVDGANQVTAGHRPSRAAALDYTMNTGNGFRTMGNMIGIVQHHPLALGSTSSQPGDPLWTYHDEDAGWTFEAAFTFHGEYKARSLFGLGSSTGGTPSPWIVGVTYAGNVFLHFRTNDGALYLVTFTTPEVTPTSVLRVRIWVDWTTGTLGGAFDGVDGAITWFVNPGPLTGKRFWRNCAEQPFIIGADIDKNVFTDFTVWAMRVSSVAIKTEPTNDIGRYWNDTVNKTTIAYLPGYMPDAGGSLSRDLDMSWGEKGMGDTKGCIFLIPAVGTQGPVPGGGIYDMTIEGGSPSVLLWMFSSPFAIERVTCHSPVAGIASMPTVGPNASVRMTDITVSGTDAGMALYGAEAMINGLECERGGITSFRFQGGNLILRNLLIDAFHPRAETAMEFLSSNWGSTILVDFLESINPATTFSAAAIRIAQSSNVDSQIVELRRIAITKTGAVPIVKLTGHPPDSTWKMGMFIGEEWTTSSTDFTAALDVGDGWCGQLDVRNLVGGGPPVVGSGAGNITLVGTSGGGSGGPPPDPTKASGIIDAVYDLGLDPTGAVDGYDALMTSIRGLTGKTRYEFPPGTFMFRRPIIAGPHAPEFHGAGMDLTTLTSGYGNTKPTLVFGMREVESDNQVTAAHRPGRAGKLDGTLSGNGFRTMGTLWGIAQDHPLSLGSWITSLPYGAGWSYWALDTAWTLEIAMTFNAGFPANKRICGLGSWDSKPAPWVLGTDGSHNFIVALKTNDQAEGWGTGFRWFIVAAPEAVDDPAAVIRLRMWIDWITGTAGFAIDGVDLTIQWQGSVPNLTGLRFMKNRGENMFFLGTDQDYAGAGGARTFDFTVWALRVSNIARKTEPANDVGRYWNGPGCISYMPGYILAPGSQLSRDLDMYYGDAARGNYAGCMFLMSATPTGGGILGGGVWDMTIENGCPGILLDQVLTPFTLENVRCRYGTVGISALYGFGPCYSLVMRNIEVGGTDAGLSLYHCEAFIDRLMCERGGITSFRFFGGNALLHNLFIAFPGGAPETVLEFLTGGWGAIVLVDMINVDTEGWSCSDAVVRSDQSAYVGSQLMDLRRFSISGTSPVPLVKLKGHAYSPGGPWQNGLFKLEQFTMYSNDFSSVVDINDGWIGTVDVRNLVGATAVTGAGAGKITVVPAPALATTAEAGTEPDPAPPRFIPEGGRRRQGMLPWPSRSDDALPDELPPGSSGTP